MDSVCKGNGETIQKVQIVSVKEYRCIGCWKKYPVNEIQECLCPECREYDLSTGMKNPLVAGVLGIVPGLGYLYLGHTEMAKTTFGVTMASLAVGFIFPLFWFFTLGGWTVSIVGARQCAKKGNKIRNAQNH